MFYFLDEERRTETSMEFNSFLDFYTIFFEEWQWWHNLESIKEAMFIENQEEIKLLQNNLLNYF